MTAPCHLTLFPPEDYLSEDARCRLRHGGACPCDECGIDTKTSTEPFYFVHDEIWVEAGMVPDTRGFLCLGCLAKRLGRALTPADFPDVAINRGRRLDP